MSNELDLINGDLGRLYAQVNDGPAQDSLASRIVGPSQPAWAAEARKRQPAMQAMDALRNAAKKRAVSQQQAKQNQYDDEIIRRTPGRIDMNIDSSWDYQRNPDLSLNQSLDTDEFLRRLKLQQALLKMGVERGAEKRRQFKRQYDQKNQ